MATIGEIVERIDRWETETAEDRLLIDAQLAWLRKQQSTLHEQSNAIERTRPPFKAYVLRSINSGDTVVLAAGEGGQLLDSLDLADPDELVVNVVDVPVTYAVDPEGTYFTVKEVEKMTAFCAGKENYVTYNESRPDKDSLERIEVVVNVSVMELRKRRAGDGTPPKRRRCKDSAVKV